MTLLSNHLLSVILFTPLAGALLLLLIPRRHETAIRWAANIFGVAGFAEPEAGRQHLRRDW